jgi:HemK-like putative methylase
MSAESESALRQGKVRFLDLELEVAPGVLVPRRETELLARTAIARLKELATPRAADVCCGSGNLACALAASTGAAVFAADISESCVALARRNVAALGLSVDVQQGDLLQPLVPLAPFDLIVCNPPYISTGRLAERGDLSDEPREAFDGGPYGLTVHQRLIKEAPPLLAGQGTLMFEFGVGQARQIERLFARAGGYHDVTMICDDSGQPRVAVATRGQ